MVCNIKYTHTHTHPQVLDNYVSLFTANAKDLYTEEVALTEAINTKPFSFVFDIAIDAFPSKLEKQANTHKSQNSVVQGRKGVLTFYFHGVTGVKNGNKRARQPSVASVAASVAASEAASVAEAGDEEGHDSESGASDSQAEAERAAPKLARTATEMRHKAARKGACVCLRVCVCEYICVHAFV
jgi:hypothetical protein